MVGRLSVAGLAIALFLGVDDTPVQRDREMTLLALYDGGTMPSVVEGGLVYDVVSGRLCLSDGGTWDCAAASGGGGTSYIFLATFLGIDGCVDGGLVPDAGATGTFTRASSAYVTMSDGGLALCASGEQRYNSTNGLYIEVASYNYLARTKELDDVSWTKSGVTVAANDTVAPDNTTTAEKLTFSANGYIEQTTTAGVEPSVWIKRSSTTGTISFKSANAGANGDWTVNLASLPDAWAHVTRNHAAVTINTEFASVDYAGECNSCGDANNCDGPCCVSGPPDCTPCEGCGATCFCNGWEVAGTYYPGLRIQSDATGRTVWAWIPQSEPASAGTPVYSSSIGTVGAAALRNDDTVTYVSSYNQSAASGSFQVTWERSSATAYAIRPIYLVDVLNIRYGEGGATWKITAGQTGAQTATSATQSFSVGETDLIKWRYKVGDKACIQVNSEAEVCSAGNISTISSGALSHSVVGWNDNPFWLKRMVICPGNDGGCL